MTESPNASIFKGGSNLTSVVAQAIVCLFLFLLVVAGAINSGLILKEPDICFLLAVGRWIVENQSLPASDPFSYGYLLADPGRPYVIYQWLSETCFYLVEKYTTTVGLLVLSGALTACAFFVIPSKMLSSMGVHPLANLGLSFWTLTLVVCHVSVRPEIFSYLFTALFLQALLKLYARPQTAISWRFVVICSLISTFWVNFHCLFILMPLLLALCLVVAVVEQLIAKCLNANTLAFEVQTLAIALAASMLCTLLNPYGFTIYPYVVHILTDPINDTIHELKPLTLETLKSPFFYPFITFSIFCGCQFVWSCAVIWRRGSRYLRQDYIKGDFLFRLLLLVGTLIGYRSVRIVPLAGLIAVASLAILWYRARFQVPGFAKKMLPINLALERLTAISTVRWTITCTVSAAVGAGLMARIVPPALPQGSQAFQPPFKAIEYFRDAPPFERLLNDPHYGAVMMWRLEMLPKLFVDPRYYMYSKPWIDDYWEMLEARQRWRELLDKYQIDCVFVKAKAPLIKALMADPNWSCVYQDEVSAIVRRNRVDNSQSKGDENASG